jgi:hypothetical protein
MATIETAHQQQADFFKVKLLSLNTSAKNTQSPNILLQDIRALYSVS